MVRIVLGIVIGYIALALTVFAGLTTAWIIIGADGAFQPGVYDQSMTWAVTAVAVNLIAAIIGGVVCAVIARQKMAPLIFAAVVFILGLIVAIPTITAEEAEPAARPESITMFEAMRDAKQPTWFCLLNPVTAAVGILLGASLVRSSHRGAPPAA